MSRKRDQFKKRDYMDKRVTSPTWGPHKRALKVPNIHVLGGLTRIMRL